MISFDESLNESAQMCKMDVYICYWDICYKKQMWPNVNSKFYEHTVSENIVSY